MVGEAVATLCSQSLRQPRCQTPMDERQRTRDLTPPARVGSPRPELIIIEVAGGRTPDVAGSDQAPPGRSDSVGRRAELAQFQENLRLPVDDLRRQFLFTIHGDAGVGKSFLTRQFTRIAREQGYLTAYIDETVYDVPTVMESIAADLARQGKRCKDFTERLDAWQRHRHELDADPAAPEELSSVLTRSAVRIGLGMAESVPVVGPLAKELNTDAVAEQADRVQAFLSRKLRNRDDVRLMLSPVDELTPTFVRELRTIASASPLRCFLTRTNAPARF